MFSRDQELEHYRAKDGAYFPPFIRSFFASAPAFERAFPTISLAGAGIKLLEVRQLNPASENINEANLSWSEDGRYLAYEQVAGGQRKILLKNLVGDYSRELMILPKGSSNFLDGMVAKALHSYNAGLRWSSDSHRYAFM